MLLRDVFSAPHVEALADRLKSACPPLNKEKFIKDALKDQEINNYGPRLEQITESIYDHLPKNYEDALPILLNSLTPAIDDNDDFTFREMHFINLAQCRYVSRFGLEHFRLSMDALKRMTQSFTAEYDIRYFLERYPDEALAELKSWADSDNMHIRRLASEGTRPRLPMGRRNKDFVKDPSPILPILEKLKSDPALYVRRSVANSLNDISKDHPDLAADIAEKWLLEGFPEADWVCTHAMRTLFKDGHTRALAVSGYPAPDGIKLSRLSVSSEVTLGGTLEFSFKLENSSGKDTPLMVDYEIYFVKNSGKHAPKVFKLKKMLIKAGETAEIQGKHPLRPQTTRKFYTGKHYLSISVNGVKSDKEPFILTV